MNLLHSLTQYRKSEFSDTFVFAGIGLTLFCVVEQASFTRSIMVILKVRW